MSLICKGGVLGSCPGIVPPAALEQSPDGLSGQRCELGQAFGVDSHSKQEVAPISVLISDQLCLCPLGQQAGFQPSDLVSTPSYNRKQFLASCPWGGILPGHMGVSG